MKVRFVPGVSAPPAGPCIFMPNQVDNSSGAGPIVSAFYSAASIQKGDLLIAEPVSNFVPTSGVTDADGNIYTKQVEVSIGGNFYSTWTAKAKANNPLLQVDAALPSGGALAIYSGTGPTKPNGTGVGDPAFVASAGPINLLSKGTVFIHGLALAPFVVIPGFTRFAVIGSDLYYANGEPAGPLTVPFGGPVTPYLMFTLKC